jgi:hypothetical protein
MIHHDLYTQPWHITQTNHPDLPPWEYFHDSFSGGPSDPQVGYEESISGCIDSITRLNTKGCEAWDVHWTPSGEPILTIQKLGPNLHRLVHWQAADDDVGETLYLGTWLECRLAWRKEIVKMPS